MNKEKITFIVNPIAGKRKKLNIESALNHCLDHKKYEYAVFYTSHKGHATEIALNAIKDSSIIIAVGGDGTINEIAKTLVGKSQSLGIIPVGSGNGLARHHGISRNVNEAIRVINNYKIVCSDTATLNEEFFISTAGCGFDAHIAALFAKSIQRGFSTYIKLVLKEFINYNSLDYKITVDNKTFIRNAFLITVANGSQFGNNAYISPLACSNDGILDITLIKSFPIHQAPGLIYRLFMKKLHQSKNVEIFSGKNIIIEQLSENAHIDGEVIKPGKKITINVHSNSLNIIVP
ncbi:MAG: YegS/Rv2252/BmrU family lipid kinase [Bacteroidota bacterium]|nr:YegS/Rv2252/BmrU family lipid kinase [Bacteroidota bacterium]